MGKEIWKEIAGYEGHYQISNYGRVYSMKRKGRPVGKILRLVVDNKGYYIVRLSKNGTAKTYTVHSFVGNAFLKKSDPSLEINHIDGVKTNNMADNLEWVTSKQNTQHAFSTGLCDSHIGSNNHNSKLTEKDIADIRSMHNKGCDHNVIGDKYGIRRSRVNLIAYGKIWRYVPMESKPVRRRAGRPKVKNRKINHAFAIERDKIEEFDKLVAMNRQSRSEVIRELVVKYIEQQTGLQEQEQ